MLLIWGSVLVVIIAGYGLEAKLNHKKNQH